MEGVWSFEREIEIVLVGEDADCGGVVSGLSGEDGVRGHGCSLWWWWWWWWWWWCWCVCVCACVCLYGGYTRLHFICRAMTLAGARVKICV